MSVFQLRNKVVSCDIEGMRTYCGGMYLRSIRVVSPDEWGYQFVVPAPDYWEHLLVTAPSTRRSKSHALYADLLYKLRPGGHLYRLGTGARRLLVMLPKQSKLQIPPLVTEAEGAAYERIFNLSSRQTQRSPSTWKYRATHSPGHSVGFVTHDFSIGEYNIAARENSDQITLALGCATAVNGLPWFCPSMRKYSLGYRLGRIIDAIDKAKVPYALMFDNWNFMTPSPAALWRTIHELYLTRGPSGRVRARGSDLWYNVFMPNGTNHGHHMHPTSGILFSTQGPITFDKVDS